MIPLETFPDWEIIAEHLRLSLGYSEATIIRTRYTYNVFVNDYCSFKGDDTASILRNGLENVNKAFEMGGISRDKLLRIRKLAYPML